MYQWKYGAKALEIITIYKRVMDRYSVPSLDCVHDNDKTNPVAADDNDQPNVNGTLPVCRDRKEAPVRNFCKCWRSARCAQRPRDAHEHIELDCDG